MAAENRMMREKIGRVEEEMFEMQEAWRKGEGKGEGRDREEEVEVRRVKAENRELMERVEWMRRRERELMEALKK